MPQSDHSHLAIAVVKAKGEGQDIFNVLRFGIRVQVNDATLPQALNDLGDAIINAYVATALPCVSERIQYREVTLRSYHPNMSDEVVRVFPAGSVGQDEGNQMPTFIAQLVKSRTAGGGRHGRGRLFMPYCSEDSTNGSELNDAAFVRLTAFADRLFADFGYNEGARHDFELIVQALSQTDDNGDVQPLPPTPQNARIVTALLAEKFLTTQRRRKVGRGS